MKSGNILVGIGMAEMMYDPRSSPTQASATLNSSGELIVRSSTCDQGTGSYAIFSQIAAQTLGMPLDSVRFELGNTDQPKQSPVSSDSFGAHFAEVRVDPDLGVVRVHRYAGAFDAGRVLNAKTARG